MHDIKFSCPLCGQHLTVDATGAGRTFACPKCSQKITVPLSAQPTKKKALQHPKWWIVAGCTAVVALIVAGLLIWRNHQQQASSTADGKTGGGKSSVAQALPGDLADGLLLYFDFDKAPVAGKVPDLSGQGNNGKAVNVQWVVDGHRGGGAVFGDNNSYITVPNNQMLNPPQFTLAAWIKTSFKDKAWRRVFDKSWDHGYDITMGGNDGGKSYQGQVTMEVAGAGAGTRGPVTDGRWHQVVGTFNAKELVFYLDGRRTGSARAKQQPAPTMFDLTIGANRSDPPAEIGPSFAGMMDDVMMFNRALSAEEVQRLFTAQGGVLEPQPASNPPDAAPAKPDANERLKQVKSLYDQGLINKDDYDKKVKEIMDSL